MGFSGPPQDGPGHWQFRSGASWESSLPKLGAVLNNPGEPIKLTFKSFHCQNEFLQRWCFDYIFLHFQYIFHCIPSSRACVCTHTHTQRLKKRWKQDKMKMVLFIYCSVSEPRIHTLCAFDLTMCVCVLFSSIYRSTK